ncbi:MAG: type II/IV secretion system protein [Planctomycetota bacterium]|nr:MAG: type II/IV secretion system protein [Planctomycetota bacterium]
MSEEPFSELGHFELDPAAAELLERAYCEGRRVVVLGRVPPPASEPYPVGMLDPDDGALVAELEEKLARRVRPIQLNDFEVRRAIARIYERRDVAALAEIELDAAREIRFEPDQAPSEMLADLLSVAVRLGATDAHIEVYKADVDLRYRIDTVLQQVTTPLSPENVSRVVNRLKVVAGLDPLERRRPQDGHLRARFREEGEERLVDLRVSTIPGRYGEDAVVRVLDPESFHLDLDELGFDEGVLARYRQLVAYPSGLVLVTGPTLSGKTNTLYATIRSLVDRQVKVVTVEDPVEFEFPKVNQKSVGREMGFADYVRAFLRQNPDVIVVGEVRDAETAETVVRAATTGHLVLSSVHTRDAVGAIARLRALDVDDDALASMLVAVLGQRLVRLLCPACKRPGSPDPELVGLYYQEPPAHPFHEPVGCPSCRGLGYHGLSAVVELLDVRPAIEAAIGNGKPVDAIRELAVAEGFRPLLAHALERVARGETSLAEVARRVAPPG